MAKEVRKTVGGITFVCMPCDESPDYVELFVEDGAKREQIGSCLSPSQLNEAVDNYLAASEMNKDLAKKTFEKLKSEGWS